MPHPSSKPSPTLDGGEKDDVEHREEHGEVALWRNPQLDVAHTLERALDLGYARNKAGHHEDWHRLAMHGDNVADAHHDGRGAQQLLIGEAELHPEQHREPHSHARKRGIEQEHHILNHEVGGATNLVESTQIYTSRELEAQSRKDVNPRLQLARHPPFHHRHSETHACWWRWCLHQKLSQLSHYSSTLQTTL